MALEWKRSQFSTSYAYLGRIQVGAIHWVSERGSAIKGYQFTSPLFANAPGVPIPGNIWPTGEDAQQEAEEMAVVFAEYIIRKVHGDEAFEALTKDVPDGA